MVTSGRLRQTHGEAPGAGVVLLWRRAPPPVTVSAGTFPEQLVYAGTTDDVI